MKEAFKNAPLLLKLYAVFAFIIGALYLYGCYSGQIKKSKGNYIQKSGTTRIITIK